MTEMKLNLKINKIYYAVTVNQFIIHLRLNICNE